MPTVENLNVSLNMQTAGFTAGIRQATDSLGRFGLAVIGIEKIISGLQAAFGSVVEQLRKIDAVGDMASNLGITTEELSRLHHAAKQSDSSVQALNTALKRAATTRPGVAFADLADELRNIKDAGERAAAAQKIFGRSWVEISALLQRSREELRMLGIESDALGNTISSDMAQAANDAVDAIQRMTDAWEGLKNIIAVSVAPTITDFLNSMQKGLMEIRLIFAEINGDLDLQNKLKIAMANIGKVGGGGGGKNVADIEGPAKAARQADVGAATRFSREGFSAAINQGMNRLAQIAQMQLNEDKKQVQLAQQTLRALERAQAVPLVV